MLKLETLREVKPGYYEEPEGELVEFIRSKRDRIRVLTRVDGDVDPEEGGESGDESYECGAALESGGECSREVDEPDVTCFQH